MREIIFRGKCIDNGKWVFGLPTKMCPNSQEINAIAMSGHFKNYMGGMIQHIEEVDPKTVGQYTGLEDKNGVEIFEGDIVRSESGNVGEIKFGIYFDVEFDNDDSIQHHGYFVDVIGVGVVSLYYDGECEWCQIIGNVFDNPELLEVAK
jgi:uncharacterized phage protein (TIGR01671 family)